MPATPYCPRTRTEVYIAGTEPVGTCLLHGGGRQNVTNIAGWENPAQTGKPSGDGSLRVTGSGSDGQSSPAIVAQRAPKPDAVQSAQTQPEEQNPKPKKGFFRRLFDALK